MMRSLRPKWLCVLVLAAALSVAPAILSPARAMTIGQCSDAYGGSFDEHQFAPRLVFCLKSAVQDATGRMLLAMSDYMVSTVGAMLLFAIAWFGVRIIGGERNMMRKSVEFLIRLGLVWAFSYNLYGYSQVAFGALDQLVALVTHSYDPWVKIDEFLNKMIQFGSPSLLASGLLGIIGGALFSSTLGIVLFVVGLMALVDILLFILRTIFTYLTAYVMVAFLLVISPLIVPLALFFWSERYFKKWLDILISAILVPVLLFAFLQMFLDIFMVLIDNVFAILGGNDFRAYWKLNQPLYSWLVPSDPAASGTLENVTDANNTSKAAVQSTVNPLCRRCFNTNLLNLPGIDFGPNNVFITQQLVFAFVTLWIFSSLMKSLVAKIPEISNNIASVTSRITMQPTSYETAIRGAVKSFGAKAMGS